LVLRARRHFCFIQTSLFGVGSSFFVWEIQKKKISSQRTKKNNQKHNRENFVSRRNFLRANASVYLQNERRIAKLSLVLLRLFFFRRSVLFHHKDRCILERVLFFSDLARIFSTSSSSKKRRGKFFFGLSERLGRNECPSSELCSHVHERL